jgi:hypothetical protein
MAGILDVKSRVMDTLVTSEGRRQIATGELRIHFASFTDRHMFYASGSDSVFEDPTSRIYFEAYSDDNDKIIIETDANGRMEPFSSDTYSSYNGNFFASGSTQQTGSIDLLTNDVIESSTRNFQRQMILGTRELWKVDKGSTLKITPAKADFYIASTTPFSSSSITKATVDDIESIFQDFRMGNVINFQYLPPITKPLPGTLQTGSVGNFTRISQDSMTSWKQVQSFVEGKQKQEFIFDDSSPENNIIGQIFEQSGNKLDKLALIDAGAFKVEGVVYPHVYFAGKLYRDSRGSLTFGNLFTLIFEQLSSGDSIV